MSRWLRERFPGLELWRSLATRALRSLGERGPLATLRHIQHRLRLMRPQPAASRQWAPLDLGILTRATASRPTAPRTSIVIPCYGQWALVGHCLAAVMSTVDLADIEILLIDDASPEPPPATIRDAPGIRYLRCEQNLGFIGAANRGAAEALGESLCFLNSDTEVQPGWLAALHRTFDEFPDTGSTGARLFYPDGRQQEAGGLVFADGSAWNYGKGSDPASPDFRFVRECDYLSGACLLLRRSVFEAVGGFHAMYRPAYFEDTDLAMRLREAGLKVRYQPAAEVVHVEGATSGIDPAQGPKAAQARNQALFATQWQTQLQRHPNAETVFEDAHRCATWRARRRVLWVDAMAPDPQRDSGSLRLTCLLRELTRIGCAVDFHAHEAAVGEADIDALGQLGVRASGRQHHANPATLLRERGRHYDFVVVSRHHTFRQWADAVRRHAPQAKLIFDTVDLHGLRELREAELRGSQSDKTSAMRTWDQESASIRIADETWVVSSVERERLQQESPDAKVRVISNLHSARADTPAFSARQGFIFVGNFKHTPNVDGLAWFIENIWPVLIADMPNAELQVVGADAPLALIESMQAQRGIRYFGQVANLQPMLDGARVNIAPLRYGAGVKGKITQALSIGLPVVTTSIGAEGIPDAEQAMCVEDEPQAFAQAMRALHEDETRWWRCRETGLRVTDRHFSIAAAEQALREALGLQLH